MTNTYKNKANYSATLTPTQFYSKTVFVNVHFSNTHVCKAIGYSPFIKIFELLTEGAIHAFN